jgi:hypothetical protein
MHRPSSRRTGSLVPRQRSFLHLYHPFCGSVSVSSLFLFQNKNFKACLADPCLSGFAVGWDYAISWLTVLPFELTAAGITIQFWRADLNIGIWIAVFLFILCIIQIFGVRGYGEGMSISSPRKGTIAEHCSRIHSEHN